MLAGQISMQWTQATGIIVAQLLGQNTPEDTVDRFMSRAWRGAFIAAGIVAAVFWVLSLFLVEEILKFPVFHIRLWRGDWKRSNVAD